MIRRTLLLITLATYWSVAPPAQAQYSWSIVKPSNTGVPGELVHFARWAPDGTLWVAARWPFWSEGGIGVFDPATKTWDVWSNWETPIPSEYLFDLEFDQNGVAWIATDRGLVRWDGSDWQVYDPSNTPMQIYRVLNVAIAPDGHLWINNSDSKFGGDAIWEFDGVSTWKHYAVPEELPWPAPWTDLNDVFVTSDGHVWVTNNTLAGVAEYDGATWTLRGEQLGVLGGMAEDGFGNLWLNGDGIVGPDAFFRWNGSEFKTYPFNSPTRVRSDPEDGSVYFTSYLGEVWRTLDGGVTIEPFLNGLNIVVDAAPDPNGSDVWVATLGAIGHFRGNATWVRDYNSYNSGLPWYWIDRMMTDRDGYFWFATGEAGLSRFDGRRWRNWGEHNAGSEPYPFAGNEPMGAAYEDANKIHWFGGNGIARWDSATGTFDGFWNWQNNPGMPVGLWTYFAEDAAGNLFSAEEGGKIYRFDRARQLWDLQPITPYLPLGNLPGMHADSQGHVFVAGWFDLYEWDGASWAEVPQPFPNYFFDLGGINTMVIGPGDVFWFGTNQGLVEWDGTEFTLYDPAKSPLPLPQVMGIEQRADGLLGLTAIDFGLLEGAVVIVDGPIDDFANWTIYSYGSSPLPHWQLGDAAFDANGDLWVSATSEGAAVLHTGGGGRLGLTVSGSCPGTVTFDVSNAPPNSEVGVVAAASTNGFVKGGTVCNGVVFEIGEPFVLPPTWIQVDASGAGSGQTTLPANRCWLEAIAIADCSTSGAVGAD